MPLRHLSGARRSTNKKDPHWTAPLDLDTLRYLRQHYGKRMKLGPKVREWANEHTKEERLIGSLASATSAELTRLPAVNRKLYKALHVGPRGAFVSKKKRKKLLKKKPSFQTADVAMMAAATAPLNANAPGSGKTYELIGAVIEAGMDDGPNLVFAPKVSLRTVWEKHLVKLQPHPVLVATGTRPQREKVLAQALTYAQEGVPFWLVANPDMVGFHWDQSNESDDLYVDDARLLRGKPLCKCNVKRRRHLHYERNYPQLHDIAWRTVINDEAHLSSIGNDKSLVFRGLASLYSDKRIVSTGTPFGGDYLKVYSMLSYLRPDLYSSKWNFADRWLVMEDNGFGKRILNELKPGVQESFWKALAPVVLRRTKAEVAPWLPPIQVEARWCEMTPKQRDQYETFARDSYLRIKDKELFGKAKLDEYTRLRQLALARCTIKGKRLLPTEDSGKLEWILQDLEELGIPQGKGKDQVVIFSQFNTALDMIERWLNKMKVRSMMLTGRQTVQQRDEIQRAFQNNELRVALVNIMAGGVAIELDEADTAMFLDETNNPDHCEQAENRLHRASKIHHVRCLYYRSTDTLEEELFDDVLQRQAVNVEILDLRRYART